MATVTVHALDAGHMTLPERFFVSPHDAQATRFVPSLSFLIQHTAADTHKKTRIIFDLGLRRDLSLYPPILEEHCKNRSPISTHPDVVESLTRGELTPSDIDYVILSHVHYDHVGYPKDFHNSRTKFIIGPGSHDLLSGKVRFPGKHSVFEPDLLPPEQSIELPPIEIPWEYNRDPNIENCPLNLSKWAGLPPFTHAMDIFGDSTVYIVNTPGHLPGHINLLCRLTTTEPHKDTNLKYVLLAGDACHDNRLLQGTHSIATWEDAEGQTCCIHADKPLSQKTLKTIKQVVDDGIDIVDVNGSSDNADTDTSTGTGTGTGKYMTIGDQTIEIQKGWFGDPRAQEPGRMDRSAAVSKKKASVEVVFAHDEVWEADAKANNRFWPGSL